MKAFYRPGSVFERDPQYYTQNLTSIVRKSHRSLSKGKKQPQISEKSSITSFRSRVEENPIQKELQENKVLKEQLHEVLMANMKQYKRLIEQKRVIEDLIGKVNENKGRIQRMESIRSEIEKRVHNIIAVDRKIKGTLDDEIAAKEALEKGEDRQIVVAILKNILQ